MKKKSVLVSRRLLPYVKMVLGFNDTVEERYYNGNVSKEALHLFRIIHLDEGIDTRALRTKADMREKEKKKIFENALVELQGSMDIVISGIQEKTDANTIMKTLTVMTSVFVPLTFIASIYGMNFEYMPELTWHLGYFGVLTVMLVVGSIMLIGLWIKGWFK